MRKVILVIFFLHVSLFGSVYESNCISCHKNMQVGIDKFFYRYLLVYSSEKEVKNALIKYLSNPSKEKSLFSEDLVLRYGIKDKSKLDEESLKNAIDTYWKKYNLFNRLK